MAINTSYSALDYSSLYSSVNNYKDIMNTYSSSSTTSSRSNSYDFYSSISSYGVNTASTLSDSSKAFLTDAKSYSSALKKDLDKLTGKTKASESSFDQKTATSSDKEKLSITSVDSSKVKNLKETSVDIDQVAKGQKNTSTSLNAKDKTDLTPGDKTIEIDTGDGKTSKIFFKVKDGDTNEDVLNKLSTAINDKNVGVSAKVTTKDGKTSLSVESNQTGVNSSKRDNFILNDVSGGGDIVSKLNLSNVEQKAQDAKYSINGGKVQTSKSNNVDLGNGVQATLKGETEKDKDAKVTLGKDTTIPQNDVRSLINNFNGLLDLAANNKNDKKSKKLYDELNGLSKTYQSSLERLGISKSENGYLKIDEKKMKAAAEDGSLEKALKPGQGYQNFGFAYGLNRTADNVNSNPSRYVTTSQTSQKTLSFNQTAKYENIQGMGLLFNSYF